MTEAELIGRRIREARERRDISQQKVADALGIPRTAVTNIEASTRIVSSLELTKLGTLFNLPVAAFFDGSGVTDLAVVRARALSEVTDSPEFGPVIDRMIDLCREGVELRRLLDQDIPVGLPDYAHRIANAGDAIRQGEGRAREERRRLGLGNAPIGNIPELIGDQGIWVASAGKKDFPMNVSGLFLNHPAIGMAILINGDHEPVRQRFSYAHEYGHALYDRQEELRLTQDRNSTELVEKRANAFAAGFLMPAGGVLDQLRLLGKGQLSRQAQVLYSVATDSNDPAEIRPRTGSQVVTFQDVAMLARHFGVSYDAMVWRLRNLDQLDKPAAATLLERREDGRRYLRMLGLRYLFGAGVAPNEEQEQVGAGMAPNVGQELRSQLIHLAVEAYRREEISQGRLREIGRKVGLRATELLELAEAAKPA
jgi:Zn-dependent peptidase ImmA (M78 family)/transcriptional regulator with XRE-family HTH domain